MKLVTIISLLLTLHVHAESIFTKADPADASAGLTYDVKQVPVVDQREFEGKRIGILAAHGVQESELTYPFEYFKSRGARVDIIIPAWSEGGKVLGVSYVKPTLWIKGTYNFKEAMDQNYDVLVLTGGSWNSNVVRKDADAIALIRKNFKMNKIISAICSGSQILIDAGIARGRKVTGTASIAIDLINAGAKFSDVAAVVDGNVVTGRGPAEVDKFMIALHNTLNKVQ